MTQWRKCLLPWVEMAASAGETLTALAAWSAMSAGGGGWGAGGGCLPWDLDVSKGALAEATVTLGSLSLSVAPHPD